MSIEIKRIESSSEQLLEGFTRLLPQLSPRLATLDYAQIESMLAAPTHRIWAAWHGERVVGLLTLVLCDLASGRKAWIEDVVVDTTMRGAGIGKQLVAAALAEATAAGASRVLLTSAPHRTAAHKLYRSMGFEPVETTLFACPLPVTKPQ